MRSWLAGQQRPEVGVERTGKAVQRADRNVYAALFDTLVPLVVDLRALSGLLLGEPGALARITNAFAHLSLHTAQGRLLRHTPKKVVFATALPPQ